MTWSPPTINDRQVAILGAGVLGRRIACVFVSAGYNVHIRDVFKQARNDAIAFIDMHKKEYSVLLKNNDSGRFGSYTAFPDVDTAVHNAWLVIEAVPEKLELKIDIMGELDKITPPDCVFASNSSSFKSRLMLEKVGSSRRKQVLNMHFCMPPNNLAVELMTDGETDSAIFPFIENVLTLTGMKPFTARKESTGFIFNRLWAAIKREIMFILAEDVSDPSQIDQLWEIMFGGSNPPPCKLMDQVGLDTVAFIEDNYVQERNLDTRMTVDWLRKYYIDQGRLGLKSDKGGLYPPSPVEAVHSPSLYVLDVGLGQNLEDLAKGAENGKITRINPEGKIDIMVEGLSLPDGIDISSSTNRMFWTNMGKSTSTRDGSIMSAKIDGSDVQVIISEGEVHTPKQLIVEERTKKLYFCDREGMSVHRCNYDGSSHQVLVQTGQDHSSDAQDATRWCVGVAVDVTAGKIYWTQKGPSKAGKGQIFRANIDIPAGSTAGSRTDIELLAGGLPEPIDLELDTDEQMLYWTDRGEHPTGSSLNRMSVREKSNEKPTILARHFNEPIGLKLDLPRKAAYVSDLGGRVYQVQLHTGKKEVVVDSNGCFTGISLIYL